MPNIVVPQLGESIVEARVARWLKKEGDRVEAGDPVVELETEKVDLEVRAEQAGVLSRIDRKEGEDVKVGEVLAVIDEAGAATSPPTPPAKAPPAEPTRLLPDERLPAVEKTRLHHPGSLPHVRRKPFSPVNPVRWAKHHLQRLENPRQPRRLLRLRRLPQLSGRFLRIRRLPRLTGASRNAYGCRSVVRRSPAACSRRSERRRC